MCLKHALNSFYVFDLLLVCLLTVNSEVIILIADSFSTQF
jgi:hypothetical protein